MSEPAGPAPAPGADASPALAPMPPRPTRGGRRTLMAALLLAVAMGSLDSSILNMSFKDLIDDLDSSTSVVVWAALGYLIAATAPMMLMTRVADVIGHGRSFQVGVTLYGIMTILCGLAPDAGTLIAMRSLQGFGMAMFLPSSFFLGAAAYPPERCGRALGILAAGTALGLVLGPPLGGWLVDAFGWRAIFLSRLPLVVLATLLALCVIRREPLADRRRPLRQLGLNNALLLTASFFGILFGVSRLPIEDNVRDPLAWAIVATGLASLGLLIRAQHRGRRPSTDMGPYRRDAVVTNASIASVAMFTSLSVYLFVLPIVMLAGLRMKGWAAGLILASVALTTAVVSPYAKRWSDRLGPELLCVSGSACVLAGYLTMLLIRTGAPPAQLMWPMVLIGIGTGLFVSPNNSLLMQGIASRHAGMASSLIGTVRNGGYALGFAVMASLMTVLQDRLEYSWEGRTGTVMSPTEALRFEHLLQRGGVWSADVLMLVLHVAALLAAAIVLVAVVYSIRGMGSRPRNHVLAVVASIAFAGLAIPAAFERSGVPGTGEAPAAHVTVAQPPVAPFGMASRQSIKLPPRPGALGKTGAEVFAGMCATCHGKDGRGLPPPQGFKIDLTTSGFIGETPDPALAEFIRNGRRIDDLRNTTGLPMPAMRDEIPDDRIELLVQYLREIHK